MAKRAILKARLRKGRQIRGVVLLPDGKPAVGAHLKISTKYRAYSWKHFSPDDYGAHDALETDEEGRFSAYVDTTISMTIHMKGYAPTIVDDYDKRVPVVGEDANTFMLSRGVRVRGRVLDAEGNPLPRAIVKATRKFEWNEFDMPLSLTRLCAANEQGEYELPPLPGDTYSFTTSSRLTADSDIEAYNEDNTEPMQTSNFVVLLRDKPPYATESVPQVVLPDLRTLDAAKPFMKLDLKATSIVKVKVKLEFPDGPPDPKRTADVGIEGVYDGSVWSGKYVVADEHGNATLLAPKGLDEVKIKTGVALHRRTPDSPLEIGQAIHLIKLGRDMDGFTVVNPKFAKLKVNLKLAQGLQAGDRISFRTEYLRMGYGEHSPDKKKMYLFGSRQSGSTYETSAIPNEPFTLRIVQRVGTETVFLHEQQLSLKPGEERALEIPIGKP